MYSCRMRTKQSHVQTTGPRNVDVNRLREQLMTRRVGFLRILEACLRVCFNVLQVLGRRQSTRDACSENARY